MTDQNPIEMLNARKIGREVFEDSEPGRALLRELDLVVAVGELESMRTGTTLYDVDLDMRVAEFVMDLDPGLAPNFLGTLPVEGDARSPSMQAAGREIASRPRGAWAILRRPDGRCDAWMSDGAGRVATPSGEKFLSTNPRIPGLSFLALYGTVLGMIIYLQRSLAVNRIVDHSISSASIQPGTRVKGEFHVGGKTWTSATFEKTASRHFVGGGDAYQVRMTKPGHSRSYVIESPTLMRIFSIRPTMPPEWDLPDNSGRLLSLRERRVLTARAEWPAIAEASGIDPETGRHATMVDTVDGLEFNLYDRSRGVFASCEISFAKDATDLVASSIRQGGARVAA